MKMPSQSQSVLLEYEEKNEFSDMKKDLASLKAKNVELEKDLASLKSKNVELEREQQAMLRTIH
jgi:hypothetical protein